MSMTPESWEVIDSRGLQEANARIYLLSLLSEPGENRLVDILTGRRKGEEAE